VYQKRDVKQTVIRYLTPERAVVMVLPYFADWKRSAELAKRRGATEVLRVVHQMNGVYVRDLKP
jgi:uridylate kinase